MKLQIDTDNFWYNKKPWIIRHQQHTSGSWRFEEVHTVFDSYVRPGILGKASSSWIQFIFTFRIFRNQGIQHGNFFQISPLLKKIRALPGPLFSKSNERGY